MLNSIYRYLRCFSLLLAVVLVCASLAGFHDAVIFLVEVRRAVRYAKLAMRCIGLAIDASPLYKS